MAANIKLKRSAVQSRVPTTSDLELGELGLNTYDGKVYMKKDDGTASIIEIGAGGGGGATDIDDLTDVDTSTVAPTDGQALVWDNTSGQWEPGTIAAAWTEGTGQLYPADAGDDVLIGGTLPSAPNITLASTGAITAGTFNDVKIEKVAGTGGDNYFVGDDAAGESITTGINNLGVGASVLQNMTEGTGNTAIGTQALRNNVTGLRNTCVGYQAGQALTLSNNTIVGRIAGDSSLSNTIILGAGNLERLRIDSTGSLLFGGTLPDTPNVTINSDGSAEFAGKITSDSTVSGDAGTILATKDYVDALAGGINSTIAGMIF